MNISNKTTEKPLKKTFSPSFFLLPAYIAFILYGSLVPFHIEPIPFDQAVVKFLTSIIGPMRVVSRSDFVANFFLFAPLTFLAMIAATPAGTKKIHPLIALLVWLCTCMMGLSIEFIQVFFPARTVSRMDVFAQIVGSFWGILLWIALANPLSAKARNFWLNRIAGRPLIILLLLYTAALTIYLLLPLDLTLSPGSLYHKFKFHSINLIPFSEPQSYTAEFLLIRIARMLPVALFFALVPTRQENAPITAALAGSCLFASLLEFLHLFVESHVTSTTDILLAASTGLLVGILTKIYQKLPSSS